MAEIKFNVKVYNGSAWLIDLGEFDEWYEAQEAFERVREDYVYGFDVSEWDSADDEFMFYSRIDEVYYED